MENVELDINEIFFSIQGESSHTGQPCIFIRLSFCNLRCSWCDSEYTFYEGKKMSLQNVMDTIQEYPCKLVEVTGGEPLAQEGAEPLMTALADAGYTVLLETSGSLDISRVDPRVTIIMDFKCPASGMVARNRYKNVEVLKPSDEVKFVIQDRHDYEWAKEIISKYDLINKHSVLMSPVFDKIENVELAQFILDDGLDVRLQLQIHKYIWDPQTRGV